MDKIIKKLESHDGIDMFSPACSIGTWNQFVRQMDYNNTYCPSIKRVVFNLKTTENVPVLGPDGKQTIDPETLKPVKKTVALDHPILATVVFFNDGTKVAVTNSPHDKVELDKDGYATDASKEAGIVYAIVKRMIGCVDDKGNVEGNGFGRILRDIIEKKSYDTQKEEKLAKEAKAKSKAEHEAKMGTAKPKQEKVSLKSTLERINEFLDKYITKLEA